MSRTACTKLAKWHFYCTSARGSSPIRLCDPCKVEIVRLLCALARRGVCISVVWKILEQPRPGGSIHNPQPPSTSTIPIPLCGSARALR